MSPSSRSSIIKTEPSSGTIPRTRPTDQCPPHRLMIRHLSLVLGVEVHPGREYAAGHWRSKLSRVVEPAGGVKARDAVWVRCLRAGGAGARGMRGARPEVVGPTATDQEGKAVDPGPRERWRLVIDGQPVGGLGKHAETDRWTRNRGIVVSRLSRVHEVGCRQAHFGFGEALKPELIR
jgi:hypothetical protein